jgi:deoxyribose-phosphate aldolase
MSLAKLIDHTNISPTATASDIKKTCREAREYGFRGVCVNPKWVKLAKQELAGALIKVVVLIDGPMGLSKTSQRLKLCQKAKKDGADELDVVINIVNLKYERHKKILDDLKKICKVLPTKVIIGSGYLTDEEIETASKLAKQAGAVCVKTATFKDPLESRELAEKAIHLGLMRKSAPGLLIKASGNIKTLADAQMMLRAGADIIGTSGGVEIMKQKVKSQKLKVKSTS